MVIRVVETVMVMVVAAGVVRLVLVVMEVVMSCEAALMITLLTVLEKDGDLTKLFILCIQLKK